MRVTILGAGAIGYATAAMLCRDGHDVVIWSPSGARTSELSKGTPLRASGAVEGAFHPSIADNCAAALDWGETVIIAVPGYAYRAVLDAAAPHFRSDQLIVFSSHMSMAALYLSRMLRERDVKSPIAALGSTIVTGRQTGAASVTVNSIRTKIDVAFLPQAATSPSLDICRALFGDRFAVRSSLLAIALSNVNPQNHLAVALCNLTRMELGESWRQNQYLTPAIARLIESLDGERLMIAKALGVQVRTIHDHFHLSFGIALGPLADMAQALAERSPGVHGPATLDSRYVTEDIPFGLVPTLALAQMAGVEAPLHRSGLRLISALYGRDFEQENNILPNLGTFTLDGLRLVEQSQDEQPPSAKLPDGDPLVPAAC